MSDSDDSDDSGLPFDVEIEKCEKRLQLARYKKKYRNVWNYATDRWQNDHLHIVFKDIEQKWRVYSDDSLRYFDVQNISEAFRYLEDVFEDRIKMPRVPPTYRPHRHIDMKMYKLYVDDLTMLEFKCDYEELRHIKLQLHHDSSQLSQT